MEEIIEFLRSSPAFHVATVDAENKPRVRPFSFVMDYKGHICFCTSSTKKFYAELSKNPNIEICSYNDKSGKWCRIHGVVHWINDQAAKEKIFVVMPDLIPLYKDATNPVLTVFYIEGACDFYDMANLQSLPRSVPIN
ncbi:pyridoxamine 5'-phosphate oxidase [Histomonas meleagridis]|uniref:pyridoxamine 5'-phosphate oxidase n=1 Tax=Histomonas meleagridis TaxID=135588 RepID=UPI00355AB0D4|nr:pyridoxamine 5'-phosphate oxidase [Histomonas meleagridis]KAH0799642.1 pyridoxamine 5'-phosphate oxidase [Histomonas meleagridis]